MPSHDTAVTIPDDDLSSATEPPGGTTPKGGSAAHARHAAPAASGAAEQPMSIRYAMGEMLGEGGMGVVHACRDRRIGRDVALKTVRTEHGARTDLVARFLREACVQGQLEHPSIVPVYDLGRDPDGNVYFTMKRVLGATFEQIVVAVREGDAHASRQYTRRKLLTAFASVCQALHFAHARGVIHRDLKPGNVMLGDFGEVYVLDWGLAKLRNSPDLTEPPGVVANATGLPLDRSVRGSTMGTPGYMSPEQLQGEPVEATSDVYALGTVLFELLAFETLHPMASREAAFASTLFGPDARPSVRAPQNDVPPELDAICVRATALDPRDRFQTARELVDAVERFLDGDRDLQRRRELAEEHAKAATDNADRALAPGPHATEARSRALRAAGRAIALEPSNTLAVSTLIRLLTDPPQEIPPEALADLRRERLENLGTGRRVASRAFLSWFLYAPLALWMGIRSERAMALTTGAWMVAAAVAYFTGRAARTHGKANLPILFTGAFAIACTTSLFGPYFFLPGFAVIFGMMFVLVPPDHSRRFAVVILAVLTIIVPAALARLGWIPQPYEIRGDAITIHASMLHLPPLPTELFLLATSVSVIVTACLMTARVRDALAETQTRLHVQAWQLRQMLPQEARAAAATDRPEAPQLSRSNTRA